VPAQRQRAAAAAGGGEQRVGDGGNQRHRADLAGVPQGPLAYLTRWRMHREARLLCSDGLSVGEVAERVGYESAAAFSKAFKRVFDLAPGTYRHAAAPADATRDG